MKRYLFISLFIISASTYAQVGIGTTNPTSNLHIAGDLLVQDTFKTNNLTTVSSTEEDFQLITRVTSATPAGELKVLDVDALNVAPVNVIDYSFTNIYLDNLTDVNLQYDANKYIVGVANFRYEGDAIKKVDLGATVSIGHFTVRTFVVGGTWHLEVRNVDLDLDVGDSVNYYITLMVYDKKYFRNLPTIVTDLGGSNTGTASAIPVFQ